MKAIALRSGRSGGSPGVRLGLALAASLVLHVAALLPAGRWHKSSPPPPVPQPLLATLQAPALVTHPEAAQTAAPEAETPPVEKPVAAAPPIPERGPTPARRATPKLLTGRALDTALAVLAREEFYPRTAIEQGLEGRVVLLLSLSDDGAVTAVAIASTSGYAVLDQAALHAASRIGALPGGSRQVLLPVEFWLE